MTRPYAAAVLAALLASPAWGQPTPTPTGAPVIHGLADLKAKAQLMPFQTLKAAPPVSLGSALQHTPFEPVPLDASTIRGLDRLLNGARPMRVGELAMYFRSPRQLAGALQTALVVAKLDQSLLAAHTDKDRTSARSRAEAALSPLKMSTNNLDEWSAAMPVSLKARLARIVPASKSSSVTRTAAFRAVPAKGHVPWVIPELDSGGNACSTFNVSDEWGFQFGDSFEWTIGGIPYPCDWWFGIPTDICYASVSVELSFSFGCNAGYQLSCCGAQVWGACEAEACGGVGSLHTCAGCRGEIIGALGAATAVGTGTICSYGLVANVGVACSLGGIDIFTFNYPVSPYSAPGPCPPKDFCPAPP